MSKQLAAIHNHTDYEISYQRNASTKPTIAGPQGGLRWARGNYPIDFEIPDNSDSKKYFNDNHLHLTLTDPATRKVYRSFSIWDDDWNDYKINFCEDTNWQAGFKTMRGGDHGKNGDRVVLKIFEHPEKKGQIELAAVTLTGLEEKKRIAKSFVGFAKSQGISLKDKKNQQKILTYMQHPDFQALREKAAEGGYQTIGLTFGIEGGIGIGVEFQTGTLRQVAGNSHFTMASTAVAIGALEGVSGTVGLYMSQEPLSAEVEHTLFAELALGEGVGVGGLAFVTFNGYFGFQVLYLAIAEEIESSVGIDRTVTKQLSVAV